MRAKTPAVMYAVMVNDEMYPDSLCEKWEWADSYLGDAQHAAAKGAHVRVVRLTVEDAPEPKKAAPKPKKGKK